MFRASLLRLHDAVVEARLIHRLPEQFGEGDGRNADAFRVQIRTQVLHLAPHSELLVGFVNVEGIRRAGGWVLEVVEDLARNLVKGVRQRHGPSPPAPQLANQSAPQSPRRSTG